MKVTKSISLDLEVIELLNKEKNPSSFVNAYLRHYFKLNDKKQEIEEKQ